MRVRELPISFEGSNWDLVYYHLVGKRQNKYDIPPLFITAGVHGDEVNGIALVSKFLKWAEEIKLEESLKGEIFVIPVMNPSGFSKRKRVVIEDGRDLNRRFADTITDSFSSFLALEIKENILKECALGIDFHDAGKGTLYIPHVRIHRSDTVNCVSCSRNMAKLFGSEYILEREGSQGMMAVALNNQFQIPVITVEVGGNNVISGDLFQFGLRGIKNILKSSGMIEGKTEMPERQYVVSERYAVKVRIPGIINMNSSLGEKVIKDQVVAKIFYPISRRSEELRAPVSGIIFSIWPDNQIPENRLAFSVLSPEELKEGVKDDPGDNLEVEMLNL